MLIRYLIMCIVIDIIIFNTLLYPLYICSCYRPVPFMPKFVIIDPRRLINEAMNGTMLALF